MDVHVSERAMNTIFNLEPLTEPPFPNLRSMYWGDWKALSVQRIAVPSLTSLHLVLYSPPSLEPLDVFADRCPHMKQFIVQVYCPEDVTISHQICRWSNLHRVDCPEVILTIDAITHLSSAPNLKSLSFTPNADKIRHLLHRGPKLVFSSLTVLRIMPKSMDAAALLLSCLRLPSVKELAVTFINHVSSWAVEACWAAALEACPFVVSVHLAFHKRHGDWTPGVEQLTLEYLRPCTAFSELRVLHVDFDCHNVSLTDADLLHLASPRLEKIIINDEFGWGLDTHRGGITLSGFVQLLQRCPSLNELRVAIDTSTFIKIPEGLDVSFPPRNGLSFNFVDSWIHPKFGLGVVSVFQALGLDPSRFKTWNEANEMLLDSDDEEGDLSA